MGTLNVDAPWLHEHVGSWRDAGIISREQAERIEDFELHGEAPAPRRLTLVTEVAAYVGSVLAVMGGAAVVGSSWDDLSFGVQLGVGIAVMAVGFVTGTWLARFEEVGMQRLGRFLWAIGTGGVALFAFTVVAQIDPDEEGWIAAGVGVTVFGVSAVLWRNLDRPLQLLTTAIGFGVTLGALSALTDSPMWIASIVLLIIGGGLAAGAAMRRIQPRMIAVAVGTVAAYVGAFMLSETNERLGSAAALVVAIVVVAYALGDQMIPILVLGVLGSLIATQALLATTITGAASALVVTTLGLIIVVAAITRGVRSSGKSPHNT
ncbi:DUF2157 domain-containing protein [Actinomycetota bacterium]